MKKFILAIAITLALPLQALAFYSDVNQDHQYYDEIKSLYDQGLLAETSNFEPDKLLTKGEVYKMILTYNNTPLSTEITFPYKDLDPLDPLAPFIQTAIDHRILKALSQDSELGAEFNAKKHFVLQTMFNSLGVGVNYLFDKKNFPFSDLAENSYLSPIAKRAADLGILESETPTKFKPFKDITRGEAAFYLYKIHEYDPADPSTIIIEKTTTNSEKKDREDLATFLNAWDAIHDSYLYQDQLDDKELQFGAIKGFISRLDDIYTTFEEPSGASAFLSSLTNELEGVGIMIEMVNNKVTVISPLKNSPAEKAGLQANDIILKVNNEDVSSQTLAEIAQKIRGPADTEVQITVQRNNSIISYTMSRAAIQVSTIESKIMENGNTRIGYISVISFGKKTFTEFQNAVNQLEIQSPAGYIIDLRNNPGGYMNIAINMISLFTEDKGTAVQVKYHDGSIEKIEMPKIAAPLAGKRIVILSNGGSASASEIMAGALQELGIAKIIGTQSFGKGTAQNLTEYNNGGLLKHTVAEWLTPRGASINGIGITPDQVIENSDEQLKAAIREF